MDALIDVAVLGEEDEETGAPVIIHVEKLRVDQEEQSFVFTVNALPVSVGIDPSNKEVDRNPKGNVKNVVLVEN
jgi:hypothetical protein